MRKLFFILLLMLALPALLFSSLEVGSGYVLIAVGDKTIEMGFLVALVLNTLIFITLYFAIVLLRSLFSTRRGVLGWAKNQRQQRGLNRTTQGLIAFVEGRYDYARKSLDKAASNASTPLVNYLFAARASSAMGDAKAVDTYLKQAELSTEGADVAIGLTQAELQIHNGQYEQALATLLRAKKQINNHPVVLGLLSQVYRQLSDWDSLQKLLPIMRKAKAMPVEALIAIERELYCSRLSLAASDQQRDALIGCWKHLPGELKKDIAVIACYGEQLIAINELDEAELILRSQLHREYHTGLVRLYGLAAISSDKQMAFAKKLLKTNTDDPELLLALARIALQQNQVDEAKAYLHQCVELGGVAGAYAQLGAVYAQQGDYRQSADYYAQELVSRPATIAEPLALCVERNKAAPLLHTAGAAAASANQEQPVFNSTDSLSAINMR